MLCPQVVLFERVTFLVIAQCSRKQHHDVHRFEKISNIIKQFKLSCGRSQSQPLSMHISNSTFCAFVGSFTSNTAIMVVSTDPEVRVASTEMNVKLARPGASARKIRCLFAHVYSVVRYIALIPYLLYQIQAVVLCLIYAVACRDLRARSVREVHQDACGCGPCVGRGGAIMRQQWHASNKVSS